MRVDVAIMTALPDEREAVCKALADASQSVETYVGEKARTYEVYGLPVSDHDSDQPAHIRVAVCSICNAGPINAAIATSRLLVDLSPTLTILVGIAGCMGTEGPTLARGDVAIGEDIYDYVLEKRQGGTDLPEWKPYRCDGRLLDEIRQWLSNSTWFHSVDFPRPEEKQRYPGAELGTVLSGHMVLADDVKKKEFITKTPTRRLIAIEMEAAGIKAVLEQDHQHNSFLMFKAFSDFAGEDKADSSKDKDKWRAYACHTAAAFTKTVLLECLGPRLSSYRSVPDPYHEFDRKARASLGCFVESFPDAPRFFRSAALALFEATIAEIATMARVAARHPPLTSIGNSPVFHANLGRGHQFLIRARKIFGTASRIIAFSVDQVSTFWRAPEMKPAVKDYIKNQAGGSFPNENVTRVFVFSTPEEAHRYARRLDFHAEKFPNTFVCSREHYEALLRNELTSTEAAIKTWLSRDFAILDYDDGNSDEPAAYFAELVGEDLALRAVGEDVVDGIAIANVRRFCATCAQICAVPGEIRDVGGVPILKWKSGLWQDRKVWAGSLRRMFEEGTAEVFHITGFTAEDGKVSKEFRLALVRMKNDLEGGASFPKKSLASKHRVRQVGLTKRINYGEGRPREIVTNGRLRYAGEGLPDNMVVMRVAEQTNLLGFLSDKEHTALRLGLFAELAKSKPELKQLLDSHGITRVEDLKRLGPEAETIYEAIEEAAGLWRVDLQNDEMVEELVEADPPSF
jgi:nucleoside phosphorylase